MKLYNIKLLGLFLLLAYVSIGVFGLFKFNHMSEKPMVNCPYTQNSFSLCQNSLAHINNWKQYSNTIFPSLFVFLFLTLGTVLYFFDKRKFFNQTLRFFYRWKYYLDNKKLYTFPTGITKWLSLFENSPSFVSKA